MKTGAAVADAIELVTLREIRAAAERLGSVAAKTGLYGVDPARLRAAGVDTPAFWLGVKAESEQPIGSFKLRGAYNRIAQLSPEELKRGVVTYSSGNHAQGVAYAARALRARAVIVMPGNAPQVKIEATRALGAEVVLVGNASTERRARAEELAARDGLTVVPPYDDPAIIAGQGTCGLEILEQLGIVGRAGRGAAVTGRTVIVAPVSGGGLLGGVAAAVKLALDEMRASGDEAPEVQVWGAEPEVAGDAAESFRTKTLVEWAAAETTRTLADGLRTQSLGVRNFAHVLRFVDGMVTVSEEHLRQALGVYLAATDLVAEPSGAVTLAAALFRSDALPRCERMVVVLSGGNIEPALKAELAGASGEGARGV